MRKTASITSLLLAILVSASAFAAQPATITLTPANPRPGETVTATISGVWFDSCVPKSPTVTIAGQTIRIEARVTPCNVACLPATTPYDLEVTFIAPLGSSRPYTVEYVTIDCRGRQFLDATRSLPINAGPCDFGASLTVVPEAVRAGETATLFWCDPSTLIPDAAFTVNLYRIYHSRSASGPFAPIREVEGRMNTSAQFTPDAGPHFYYVEAHGCTTTITGECRPTIVLSNIVSLNVATAAGCLPSATTLCLGDGRFAITTRWEIPDGTNGDGRPVRFNADSGYFWFFNPDNAEVTVKVLNACSLEPPRFWVFASGMTNVEVEMVVVDTLTNMTRVYTNPLGTPFQPILDTNAFNTCR